MEDDRVEISNNRAERASKPFVIGRKNWMFSNTPSGARASAAIYSIVESAKANGIKPLEYLEYLFESLPNIDINDKEELDKLMPYSQMLPLELRSKNLKTSKSFQARHSWKDLLVFFDACDIMALPC